MTSFVRPVPVFAPDGTYQGHAEGNLRGLLALQQRAHRRSSRRHERNQAMCLIESDHVSFQGRTREKLEAITLDPGRKVPSDRKGEDRSWKYCRGQPKPSTLCRRLKLKPQYQ